MWDFIVIGGGIGGLSAAAHLAPLGSVLVMERERDLAYHASGRSAAMYLRGYGNAAVRVLNDASADGHAAAGVLGPRRMLMVAPLGDEAQLEDEAADMGLTRVTLEEARSILPILNLDRVSGAAAMEADAVDTDALCQYYARQCRAAGGVLRTGAGVDGIERGPDGWTVRAGDAEERAKVIVNAAGAWVDQVAELAGVAPLGFQPFRRSMAVLPAPVGHDVAQWPFTLCTRDAWYAKPEGGRWLVSPSEEDLVEPHDAWADDMVIAEGLARYEAMVTAPVTRVETSWAGLRTMSPDRALVLGPDPGEPGFIWCAGQGGYGFQVAPAAGKLIADLLGGRAPDLSPAEVAALGPARFG